MKIVVCVKQVPEVTDADLEIVDGTLDSEDLVMDLNEWDLYAVEEAVRLKEDGGGSVTVVTIGDEEAEDGLRKALAMGADAALRIDGEDFAESDAAGVARGLERALRSLDFDLVLTGVQASDTGWAQVGGILAERLGLPHATLAVAIEAADGALLVQRELEANTLEEVTLPLPCLVTVQTGINQPRYVSIMGIRRARGLPLEARDAEDLGLAADEIGLAASSVACCRLELPARSATAEMLAGSLESVCQRAADLIREHGGLA